MRSALLGVLFASTLSVTASAQHLLFEEAFENGIPASWTNIHRSAHIDPWHAGSRQVDGSRDIHHEFFCTNGFTMRDNLLLSPVIDLSGVSRAFFECGQHQQFPTSRLYNAVEITTNGGQSTTVIYQETGTWSGFGTIKADISAWAGQKVQIGFHYRGVIANGWSVDNVRVTTSPVQHTVANLVQLAQATYTVSGATPGNSIGILVSTAGAGPLPSPWGNVCLAAPIVVLPVLTANASGSASVSFTVPSGTKGIVVYSQAVEISLPATIRITNSLAPAVQ